ncbi:MAG: HAD family hydrolase [Elusimicrobiales bacterium]
MNTFIFDLDGTLIDSKVDIVNSFNLAIKEVLNPNEVKDPVSYIGYSVKEMVLNLYPDTSKTEVDEIITKFRFIYDNSYFPNTRLFTDSIKVLNKLKNENKRIFLLTNKPSTATIPILKKLSILDYFESIITRDVNIKKNKSELLKELIINNNLVKNDTLLIGDTEIDVFAANENNLKVAIVKNGYGDYSKILKLKPDYIIENIGDLINLI